ncbi:MAG TPA: hypothetical protein DIW81_25230 [Planctomycetaceae bacterium]|nr:hypothetical protein [Rubinisphaera sp.]HCS54848.1 hypothetical protein [Planctomycetaceae bacterium]
MLYYLIVSARRINTMYNAGWLWANVVCPQNQQRTGSSLGYDPSHPDLNSSFNRYKSDTERLRKVLMEQIFRRNLCKITVIQVEIKRSDFEAIL